MENFFFNESGSEKEKTSETLLSTASYEGVLVVEPSTTVFTTGGGFACGAGVSACGVGFGLDDFFFLEREPREVRLFVDFAGIVL